MQIPASIALGFRRVLAILAPLFTYFLLLSYVPLPDGVVSGMSDTFTMVTARYNVLGIFILGSLSGFGSVTTAWGYFPLPFGRNRHVGHSLALCFASITVRSIGGFRLEWNSTA
jgi:The Golgi pH Regulator (GPHR) Family N-terminal